MRGHGCVSLLWRVLMIPACSANAGSAPADPPPADKVVFSVGTGGGMAPALSYALASPSLQIYGDGRILTTVSSPAIQAVPARYDFLALDWIRRRWQLSSRPVKTS